MDFLYKFVPKRLQNISAYMDFDGQRKAEKIFQITIGLFAAVGFAWGYTCQQFSQTVYILLAGFVLSCVLTLPPWPMYRRKPLKWQPARQFPSEGSPEHSSPDQGAVTQTKGKKKK